MKNLILILILMLNTFQVLNAQEEIACPTNIDEIEKNSLLSVFPNPSDGTFQIVYASTTKCPPAGWGGILMVNIKDSKYKTVYSETIEVFEGEYNQTINLSTMEKGVYTIEMLVGKQMKVKREVVK